MGTGDGRERRRARGDDVPDILLPRRPAHPRPDLSDRPERLPRPAAPRRPEPEDAIDPEILDEEAESVAQALAPRWTEVNDFLHTYVSRRRVLVGGVVVAGAAGLAMLNALWHPAEGAAHPPLRPRAQRQELGVAVATPAVVDNRTVAGVRVPQFTMVDTAYAESDAMMTSWRDRAGASAIGVYIGRPGDAVNIWSPEDVRRAAAIFDMVLPIYAGRQQSGLSLSNGHADGLEAVGNAIERGFGLGSIIGLDVEAGSYSGNPGPMADYITGWVQGIQERGYKAMVYSSAECLQAIWNRSPRTDFPWLAHWLYPGGQGDVDHSVQADSPQDLQGLWPLRAWQYCGGRPWAIRDTVDVSVVNVRLNTLKPLLKLAQSNDRSIA